MKLFSVFIWMALSLPAVAALPTGVIKAGFYGKSFTSGDWIFSPVAYNQSVDGTVILQKAELWSWNSLMHLSLAESTLMFQTKSPVFRESQTAQATIEMFSQTTGIKDWHTVRQGRVTQFSADWKKGNRRILIGIYETPTHIGYSVAYLRPSYLPMIQNQVFEAQRLHLEALSAFDGSKPPEVSWRFPALISAAYADPVTDLVNQLGLFMTQTQGNMTLLNESFNNQSDAWRQSAVQQSDQWRVESAAWRDQTEKVRQTFGQESARWNQSFNNFTKPENLAKVAFGVSFGAFFGAAAANMVAEGIVFIAKHAASGLHELITEEKKKKRAKEALESYKKFWTLYEGMQEQFAAVELQVDTLAGLYFTGDEAKRLSEELDGKITLKQSECRGSAKCLEEVKGLRRDKETMIGRYLKLKNQNLSDHLSEDIAGLQTGIEFMEKEKALLDKKYVKNPSSEQFRALVAVYNQEIEKNKFSIENLKAQREAMKKYGRYDACGMLLNSYSALMQVQVEMQRIRLNLLDIEYAELLFKGVKTEKDEGNEKFNTFIQKLGKFGKSAVNDIRKSDKERMGLYLDAKEIAIDNCIDTIAEEADFVRTTQNEIRAIPYYKERLESLAKRKEDQIIDLLRTPEIVSDAGLKAYLEGSREELKLLKKDLKFSMLFTNPIDTMENLWENAPIIQSMAKYRYRQKICKLEFDTRLLDTVPNFVVEYADQKAVARAIAALDQGFKDRQKNNDATGYLYFIRGENYLLTEDILLKRYLRLLDEEKCFRSQSDDECRKNIKGVATTGKRNARIKQLLADCDRDNRHKKLGQTIGQ